MVKLRSSWTRSFHRADCECSTLGIPEGGEELGDPGGSSVDRGKGGRRGLVGRSEVGAVCVSPTDRKGRSRAEAKVRISTHTRLLSGADGSCAAALVRDEMSKGGSGRSAQWCGPVAPCERSLLRDATLVPDLPPDARRGQGGDLGHQLPGPLTLAQQKHARVQALGRAGGEEVGGGSVSGEEAESG